MFIRSQNVLMNRLNFDDVAYIDDEIDRGMKRTQVRPGDVFINITGASIGRAASFDHNGIRANVNQHVCIIRPRPDQLDSRYLATYLCTPQFQETITRLQRGGTRQALTFDMIAAFDIPLPPLSEQKRIAAILDKADGIRRRREEGIRLTEDLLRSAFLDMFGDGATQSVWKENSLEDVVDIASGQVDPKEEPYSSMQHVGGDNIASHTGEISGTATAEELGLISGKFEFSPQDVLYSKIRPALNKVACPDFEGICSADIYPIRPRNGEVSREFLACLLRSDGFLTYATKHSSRTNIPKINRTALLAFQVKLPPFSDQLRFDAIVSRIREMKRHRLSATSVAENSFGALVQRAFRGEL
jgi:type I restriction enzyme, S subunit